MIDTLDMSCTPGTRPYFCNHLLHEAGTSSVPFTGALKSGRAGLNKRMRYVAGAWKEEEKQVEKEIWVQTYCVHQPYAPNRCSASSPSHLHWDPCWDQAHRRAIDGGLKRQHIVAGYTSFAVQAAAAAVVVDSEPVELRHLG